MNVPPVWTEQQLDTDLQRAIADFRHSRLQEPLEAYLEHFDAYQSVVEDVLEQTVDLLQIQENALSIVTDPKRLEVLRYLAGPPISSDDLKTVLDTRSLAPNTLRNNPIAAGEIVQVIRDALDRRRFPWVAEEREPSESERIAAVLASSALIATRRTETQRRTEGKSGQEALVQEMLVQMGFVPVPTRDIRTIAEAPRPGEFCAESLFGGRKADFIVGLRDDRIMPIECKVSNSATNSVKRLNNDAAVKAVSWRTDFGTRQVVPTAVLSGVFALRNLVDAQARGLTLFWAHDLLRLREWIERAVK